MKNHPPIAGISLGLFLWAAPPAIAQEPNAGEPETKNEITAFGGVSLMEASGEREFTLDADDFSEFPGFPMVPGFPHGPGTFPGVTARGEGSLGSSALFGARYSRRIKERWRSKPTSA